MLFLGPKLFYIFQNWQKLISRLVQKFLEKQSDSGYTESKTLHINKIVCILNSHL